jgi:hypothetical protein
VASPLNGSDRRGLVGSGSDRGLRCRELRDWVRAAERLNASEEERRKLVVETLRHCEELEREVARYNPERQRETPPPANALVKQARDRRCGPSRRCSGRAPRSRRLRTARGARSPGRSTSSDDDPDPVRPRRTGALWALVDVYLWPSTVWIRLALEAEERLRRYARGEDV